MPETAVRQNGKYFQYIKREPDPGWGGTVLGSATEPSGARVTYEARISAWANTPPADEASSREQGRQRELWRAFGPHTTKTKNWS
jgi:hypothetical protein